MKNWFKSLFKAEPGPVAPVVEPPKAMKIHVMTLASARAQAHESGNIERYTPPKGVIPAGAEQSVMALDATPYDYINEQYYGARFKGYQYLALIAQLPEYRKMAETTAKEMTRKWIRVEAVGDGDKSDKVKELTAALKKHRIQSLFRRAEELDCYFGRGQIFIDVKTPSGMPSQADPAELAAPLFIDKAKITKGSLIGFRIVEPVWTYPSAYNSTNPLAADFYRPTSWYVMGKNVHASRLLMFISRPVPDMLKASYNFGGLSLSQLAEPYVNNWLRTRDSVGDLVHSFSVSGIKTNMAAELAGVATTGLGDRAKLFNELRDNRGVFLLDKESEDFFQFNTPLSGLDALQAQAQEQMASVSSIPLVKLLGISPAGLNASSDGEIRVFYDFIHAEQEKNYREPLKTILDILQLDMYGMIDPEITAEFEPLYQLDEIQRATVRKQDADTDAVLITAGVIDADDARERLIADKNNGYVALEANPEIDDDEGDDGGQ